MDHTGKEKCGGKIYKSYRTMQEYIRRTIYSLYKEDMVATLQLIQQKLADYPDYTYMETLRQVQISCGFYSRKLISAWQLPNQQG